MLRRNHDAGDVSPPIAASASQTHHYSSEEANGTLSRLTEQTRERLAGLGISADSATSSGLPDIDPSWLSKSERRAFHRSLDRARPALERDWQPWWLRRVEVEEDGCMRGTAESQALRNRLPPLDRLFSGTPSFPALLSRAVRSVAAYTWAVRRHPGPARPDPWSFLDVLAEWAPDIVAAKSTPSQQPQVPQSDESQPGTVHAAHDLDDVLDRLGLAVAASSGALGQRRAEDVMRSMQQALADVYVLLGSRRYRLRALARVVDACSEALQSVNPRPLPGMEIAQREEGEAGEAGEEGEAGSPPREPSPKARKVPTKPSRVELQAYRHAQRFRMQSWFLLVWAAERNETTWERLREGLRRWAEMGEDDWRAVSSMWIAQAAPVELVARGGPSLAARGTPSVSPAEQGGTEREPAREVVPVRESGDKDGEEVKRDEVTDLEGLD